MMMTCLGTTTCSGKNCRPAGPRAGFRYQRRPGEAGARGRPGSRWCPSNCGNLGHDAQPDSTIVGRAPRVSRYIEQKVSRHAKFGCGHDPAPALPEPGRPEDGIIVGDYTYFLDNSGLSILEPAEPTAAGVPAGERSRSNQR